MRQGRCHRLYSANGCHRLYSAPPPPLTILSPHLRQSVGVAAARDREICDRQRPRGCCKPGMNTRSKRHEQTASGNDATNERSTERRSPGLAQSSPAFNCVAKVHITTLTNPDQPGPRRTNPAGFDHPHPSPVISSELEFLLSTNEFAANFHKY